jgi:hypothetical protein
MRKISTWSKLEFVLAGIIAIGGAWTVLSSVYDHFEKSSAARKEHAALEQNQINYEQATYDALKQDRVDRLERENQRIRRDLANPQIEIWEREQAVEDRVDNQDKIACIRKDEC